jgi:hypothetical protein
MTITLLDPRTGKPVIIVVPDERSNGLASDGRALKF